MPARSEITEFIRILPIVLSPLPESSIRTKNCRSIWIILSMLSTQRPSTCAYPSSLGRIFARPSRHQDAHLPRSAGSHSVVINLTTGKVHDVNILDILPLEKDAVIAMDRGYVDFTRLYAVNLFPAFFVIRVKSNLRCCRLNF
jgi:hypothetical protein